MASDELRFLDIITMGQMVAFGLTWWLAIVYSKKAALHVRFIIATVFAVGNALVLRVFFWMPGFDTMEAAITAYGGVLVLLRLTLIALDWREGMKRSLFWVATLALSMLHIGYVAIGRSDA